MEKEDIIILVLVFVVAAVSLYRRYAMKNKGIRGKEGKKTGERKGLSGQPDDYEPYSKGQS
jgi:hypothetical protein